MKKDDLIGYCINCKNRKNIINPILGILEGRTVISGNCEKCGTKMSKIAPPEITQKDLEDIKEKEELKEKKEVQKYIETSKSPENKKKLNDYGYIPPMRKDYFNLIKFALFLLSVLVVILLYRTYFSEEFIPSYNASLSCGNNTISCPEIPKCSSTTCPSCDVICGDCIMPDELLLNLVNGTT